MKRAKKLPAVSRSPVKGQKLDTTPKIRAFKYSTKNKTEAAYRDRLKVLKNKFGVAFTFSTSAKLTGGRKAAITRRVAKYAEFLNPANGFRFVSVSKKTLGKISHRREVSPAQRTKKGIFVPVPKSRVKTAVKVDKKTGEVSTRTGKFKSTTKRFRSVDVVKNPELILKEAKKRGAERVFVSIKGHRGKSEKYGYSLKQFMRYFSDQLLPDLEDAQDNEDYSGAFKNWFGVEFVSYKWGAVSRTKTKTKKKK